jgi:hypothetical protein
LTYSRIPALEQRLCRGEEKFHVGVKLFFNGSGQHGSCIPQKQIEQIDLPPLIHIDQDPTQTSVLLMQHVETRWAHGFECYCDASNGERGAVT